METETRPAVELTDSLLVEGNVVLAHRVHHKLISAAVLTREELQAFVQQAHDVYGVTADPFATPGSADDEPLPFPHTANCPDPCQHDAEGDPWPDHVGHGAGR